MKRALAVVMAAACAGACAGKQRKPAEAAPPAAPPAAPVAAPPAAPVAAAPQGTPDAPFRAEPPPPAQQPPFHAPVPRESRLSNGLTVYFVERHELPLVTLELAVRSGADTVTRPHAGLPSLVLDLLDEGTRTRDAAAIARGFEDLAASFRAQADADASFVAVSALSSTLAPVLELYADAILHPAFRAADVDRVRQQRLGQLAQALDDPQSIGAHVLSRVLFGDAHPWAFPAEGTIESIKAVKPAELAAWHKAHFQPGNAALFVVGDTTEAQLLPLLEQRFGAWKDGKAAKPAVHELPGAAPRVITLVDKPDAPQSQIWIGEIGVSSLAPDVFPVRVMNNILGGSFNSRLNGNLRTEHAYSYGVFSFYDTHREAGPFVAAGGVVADKTAEAVAEFLKELTRMKSGDVSDAELSDAKDGLVRTIPALFTSGEATAGAFARAWAHGLPADYYARYQERIEAVTRVEVAKAARERLHPENMAVVVVGPARVIEPKLRALGLGRLEIRDAAGEAAQARAAAGAAR